MSFSSGGITHQKYPKIKPNFQTIPPNIFTNSQQKNQTTTTFTKIRGEQAMACDTSFILNSNSSFCGQGLPLLRIPSPHNLAANAKRYVRPYYGIIHLHDPFIRPELNWGWHLGVLGPLNQMANEISPTENQFKKARHTSKPVVSMHGLLTYIWMFPGVNTIAVGKSTSHMDPSYKKCVTHCTHFLRAT